MNYVFKKYEMMFLFIFLFVLKNNFQKSRLPHLNKNYLTRKNFSRVKKYLQLKKSKSSQKIDLKKKNIANLKQEQNTQKIEEDSQIASNFLNDIMINFLPGLIYMPFLSELFAVIMQESDKFVQVEVKKLLDIFFLDIGKKIISDIESMNLGRLVSLTDRTYEKLSQQYRYALGDLKNLKKMPFVLATSPINFLEIKKIAFEKNGYPNIKKVLNSMLENKQIYSLEKLNREFIFLPRPTQTREDLLIPITKSTAEKLAQEIWILFSTNDRFILELILGYMLVVWAEVDTSVQKNILSYLAKHVKEKNKIKIIYENMAQTYKNNILYLDLLLKNIFIKANRKEPFSLQMAIKNQMKKIYMIKKEKKINNIKDNVKVAGKIMAAAAVVGGVIYFYNPSGFAKGFSWISSKSTAGLKSILPSIKGWWNSKDSLNIGISSLVFSPWKKLGEGVESIIQTKLIDEKLFNQVNTVESKSLFHKIVKDFAQIYITKNILMWGSKSLGLSQDKINLNILSKIKSKVSDFMFNQNMYYLFTLGRVFDEVLESTILVYLFESRVLELNIGIAELIQDRRKNDVVTQELKEGYAIFENAILESFIK